MIFGAEQKFQLINMWGFLRYFSFCLFSLPSIHFTSIFLCFLVSLFFLLISVIVSVFLSFFLYFLSHTYRCSCGRSYCAKSNLEPCIRDRCMCSYLHTYIYMYIAIFILFFIYIYIHVCTSVFVCVYICFPGYSRLWPCTPDRRIQFLILIDIVHSKTDITFLLFLRWWVMSSALQKHTPPQTTQF